MGESAEKDDRHKETPTEIKEMLSKATTEFGLRAYLNRLDITRIVNNPLNDDGEHELPDNRYNPIRVSISRSSTDPVDDTTVEAFDEAMAEHGYVKKICFVQEEKVLDDDDSKLYAEMEYHHVSELSKSSLPDDYNSDPSGYNLKATVED